MFTSERGRTYDLNSTGTISPQGTEGEQPVRLVRMLPMIPLAGLIGLLVSRSKYRVLDESAWFPFVMLFVLATLFLISYVQKKLKSGEDVRPFFPYTLWLASGPLILAGLVFLNGALDRGTPEQHPSVLQRLVVSHGRSTSYFIEVKSWRPNHSTEKIPVPASQYAQFRVGDAVSVEVHRGALGIPWLGTVRKSTSAVGD